jgi:phage-related protein
LGDSAVTALDLTQDWSAGSEGAINSLDKKYNTFGSAVEGIWRRLVVSVSPFTDKLLDLVNSAMPAVMGAFDRFDATVGPTMNSVGGAIDRVVTFVNGLWSRFRASVDTDAVGPLKYWQDWADKNLPMVETLFNNILSAIQGFWAIFGDDIMHIVDNTFNTAWTIIDTVMRTIGDIVTLALQLLTGDWEGAMGTVEGITQRIWDAIKTIIGNQLDSIKTAITSIDWGATGNAIIQGIADGISNGASYIINAAEDAAQSAYEAAKSWLGISSPSKKAADDIGEPFAEGVGVGALRGLRSLAGQIDAGLASVMGDISTPQPAMAGASERPSITLNIYLQGSATYEDGRNLGAGVADELRARGHA